MKRNVEYPEKTMPKDKRNINKRPIAVIEYSDMDFIWIANHWDLHLSGLCRYNGKLCQFETDRDVENWDTRVEVSIYPLSLTEKLSWLKRKKLFEWCVGYHFSYRQREQGANFYFRRPRLLWALIFAIYYKKLSIFSVIRKMAKRQS